MYFTLMNTQQKTVHKVNRKHKESSDENPLLHSEWQRRSREKSQNEKNCPYVVTFSHKTYCTKCSCVCICVCWICFGLQLILSLIKYKHQAVPKEISHSCSNKSVLIFTISLFFSFFYFSYFFLLVSFFSRLYWNLFLFIFRLSHLSSYTVSVFYLFFFSLVAFWTENL